MSYAGPGALSRARLGLQIVRERLELTGVDASELRYDIIGDVSTNLSAQAEALCEPREARIRVAGRTRNAREAQRIGAEVETLYTNGPAGGGGATRSVRPVIAAVSALMPRESVKPAIEHQVA